MVTRQTVRKWGNGVGVRLPKSVLEAARLQADEEVDVEVRGRSIVLTPREKPKKVTLASLLNGVTPEMVGGEVSWGEELGVERYG